jgi:hypothetical protein
MELVSIGPLLQRAAEQLDVGEMVQCGTFSLFEAMSAVEIGNPKMDAGARPQVERVPLQERPLPLDLTPPQLLSWMDRLLTLEATWHVGGAMAQTVYSSLHMMQIPRRVRSAVCTPRGHIGGRRRRACGWEPPPGRPCDGCGWCRCRHLVP